MDSQAAAGPHSVVTGLGFWWQSSTSSPFLSVDQAWRSACGIPLVSCETWRCDLPRSNTAKPLQFEFHLGFVALQQSRRFSLNMQLQWLNVLKSHVHCI